MGSQLVARRLMAAECDFKRFAHLSRQHNELLKRRRLHAKLHTAVLDRRVAVPLHYGREATDGRSRRRRPRVQSDRLARRLPVETVVRYCSPWSSQRFAKSEVLIVILCKIPLRSVRQMTDLR